MVKRELLELISKIEQLSPVWYMDPDGDRRNATAMLSNGYKAVAYIGYDEGKRVAVSLRILDTTPAIVADLHYRLEESYQAGYAMGSSSTRWRDAPPDEKQSAEYLLAWLQPKAQAAEREFIENAARESEKAKRRFFNS